VSTRLANALTVGAFALTAVVGFGVVAANPATGAAASRIEIRIRYSHYEPSRIDVPVGQPVTIVLRNDDPIEHEWIVGDAALHDRHRTGTEEHHGERPTEVSIPALSTVETTVTFPESVAWNYICHLPGHEAYGMVGLLLAR
jgi:uncharacterized cupredoxin-like copper-binding protein